MKKRKPRTVGKKTTARKKAAKKTVVKKKHVKISDQLAGIGHHIESINRAIAAIRYDQETITRSVDAVMKDYIRHPLKIDGMNQQAFRALVDAAARNHPEQFKEDFLGVLDG